MAAGTWLGAAPHGDHIWLMADPAKRNVCPICGKPAEQRFRPFCSRRCADVDLNRWLSGVYAVPVVAEEEGDDLPDKLPRPDDDVAH